MAVLRKPYRFTTEGKVHTITLPALYGGIQAESGLSELTGTPPEGAVSVPSIKAGIESGKITRVVMRGISGSKRVTVNAFFPTSAVIGGACDNVVGKTLTKTVTGETPGTIGTQPVAINSCKVKTRTKLVY